MCYLGKGANKSGKVWSFTIPPSDPQNVTPFFSFGSLMGETNFTLGPKLGLPTQNIICLFFDTGGLFPRIWAPLATFKAVLIAVDMTKAPQTKCKTCFGVFRMILHALWKNAFLKKQCVFFTILADPLPPPPKYGKRTYFFLIFFFFSALFPKMAFFLSRL